MHKSNFSDEDILSLPKKILLVALLIIYPLLVSVYTMLPPLIGLVGYIMILNFSKEKFYIFIAFFYLLNLDLNLSLPLFLSLFTILVIYMFMYTPLKRLVRCKVCLQFALIAIIDFLYYFFIFIYDFMLGTSTVLADIVLVYYIVIDILLGMLL